jgi:hypothetical protein
MSSSAAFIQPDFYRRKSLPRYLTPALSFAACELPALSDFFLAIG